MNRGGSGTRPASVGGLQAPTNCMRRSVTQLQSLRQKPPCSVSCLKKLMTRCVPGGLHHGAARSAHCLAVLLQGSQHEGRQSATAEAQCAQS
eukprot:8228-Heterococcus_DN1.PRE.2